MSYDVATVEAPVIPRTAAGLALILTLVPLCARAQCAGAKLLHGRAPIHGGQLAFHAQNPDKDLFYQSHLYIYDFKSRGMVNSLGWTNAFNPLNPNFSPDGRWIVFTARIGDGPQYNKHVFAWSRSPSDAPKDLTSGLSGVNAEDPRFSFDGRYVVFKLNKNIAIMSVTYDATAISAGEPWSVTKDGQSDPALEASGPTMSAHNKFIYFFQNSMPNEHLEKVTLDKNLLRRKLFDIGQPDGTESYYPVLRRDGNLFFARHDVDDMGKAGVDQLYRALPDQNPADAAPMPSNFCAADNSDPAPAGDNALVFSSTAQNGRYELYVTDLTRKVWDFAKRPEINETEHASGWYLLGASWTPRDPH
jgi:Tol biopolymer transport system component